MTSIELENDTYDVAIIGTGLAESIAAAALAKVGRSVLHLDPNEYYGAEQASLTLDELVSWSDDHIATPSSSTSRTRSTHYTQASTSGIPPSLEADKRRYALSLFPSILPSRGTLISTLIASDVGKYVSFRLLDSVSVCKSASGQARRVPGSKEDVFKDKSIGLAEKRKLMKFLMFAAGEFETDAVLVGKEEQPLIGFLQSSFQLAPELAQSVSFAIAHCTSPSDPTLSALLRTRRYLRSVGRYGSGAFLIGQYGGAGEVAQGFCRACAVHGGTYVLGPQAIPDSIKIDDAEGVRFKLPCHPRPVTAKRLISNPIHLPETLLSPPEVKSTVTTARCIAILPSAPAVLRRKAEDGEETSDEEGTCERDDTAVVLFPPQEGDCLVRALIMGEGTGSCPPGQSVLYLSMSIPSSSSPTTSPADRLRPYLSPLSSDPLFEAYYLCHQPISSTESTDSNVTVLDPYHGAELLTEGLDWEAEQGEKAFWSAMGGREAIGGEEGKGFFDKEAEDTEDVGDGD